VAFGSITGLGEIRDVRQGERGWVAMTAIIGLGWQLVVFAACAAVVGSLLRARRDLFGRRQVLLAVAQTSVDWLWETDSEHRLTYSSDGVLHLLGYQPDELLGRTFASMISDRDQLTVQGALCEAALAGEGWEGLDRTWRHADGSTVLLRGSAAPITDRRGRLVGYRGTRRSITDAETVELGLGPTRVRIATVLRDRTMTTALQPIVDLDSGLLAGVEALARFEDGRSPHVWFGEALKTGQALELDAFAFHAALTTLAWVPPGCYLSVNATPELLLSGLLQRGLLDSGLPLDQLVIEVTEHAPVGCYPDLQRALSELRGRGVRLAVDDTGAGYASLSHVLQLRPSIIKIDRSLITDVSTDQARRSLVTALVLLGLDLGATVTGEGIETVEERSTLADLGVGFGQGYLLARPSTNRSDWQQWASRNWLSGAGGHARSLPADARWAASHRAMPGDPFPGRGVGRAGL
jgi:PAS domain S-box-containing protein